MGVRGRFSSLSYLASLMPVVIFGVAFFFLGDFVADYDFKDIWLQIKLIPKEHLYLAAGLTVFSYLLMSTYDLVGFAYIQSALPHWKVVTTSLIAYALNNSTGFGGVVGGAFRFRNYMYYGVRGLDVLKVVTVIVASFWLGTLLITGTSFLIYPFQFSAIPSWIFRALGALFILIVLAFIILTYKRRAPLLWKGKSLQLPSFKLSLVMLLLASLDWVLAASVLYMLLPDQAQMFFPVFVAIFSTSTILALLTNMPGGFGVLETMILVFVGSSGATANQIFGSLVVYRFIFNFCPFVLGLLAVGFIELRRLLKNKQSPSSEGLMSAK